MDTYDQAVRRESPGAHPTSYASGLSEGGLAESSGCRAASPSADLGCVRYSTVRKGVSLGRAEET